MLANLKSRQQDLKKDCGEFHRKAVRLDRKAIRLNEIQARHAKYGLGMAKEMESVNSRIKAEEKRVLK